MKDPIITSLLDTDFYKLTMGQVFMHQYPNVWGRYEFKCRNNASWTEDIVRQINEELDHLCTLRFTDDEINWLYKKRFFKRGYLEFLRMFQYNRKHIHVWLEKEELRISVEGPVFLVSYFELPCLSIVNEVYFRTVYSSVDPMTEGFPKLLEKIEFVKENPFRFSDFGTRRRFSKKWQDIVVKTLSTFLPKDIFTGTSNPYLAMKYDLTPIGTMAHESIQLPQAIDGVTLADSQKYAFQKWVDEYRGDLGYALSDTLGFDKFLKDFDLYFAKLYDGVRHDSGDPFTWAKRMIKHYESLGIDPKSKQLIFSDGLDFYQASRLHKEFNGKAKISFGIGTNLSNDVGVIPLQIVMKIVEANGRPVAKISDSDGKTMCEDKEFLSYLKKVSKL